jgi:hypothetical protein
VGWNIIFDVVEQWRSIMKTLIAAVALATLVASPVLAQSKLAPYADTAAGMNAFAQAPRGTAVTPRSDAVIDQAGNVEADPDVNIRSQLQRENNEGF